MTSCCGMFTHRVKIGYWVDICHSVFFDEPWTHHFLDPIIELHQNTCDFTSSPLPAPFRVLCKSLRGDFFTGWWLMINGYTFCKSLYSIVIQLIIMTTKHSKMKLKVTHWKKLTSLWLPDFPQCTPCFYIPNSQGKSWKVSPFFRLITSNSPEPKAQSTMQLNQLWLLGNVQFWELCVRFKTISTWHWVKMCLTLL